MTDTETRLLALALQAVTDADARVVLADAIEESAREWPTGMFERVLRLRSKNKTLPAWTGTGPPLPWMLAYFRTYLKDDRLYLAAAAALMTKDWHNPDDPANEAEPWHVAERCRRFSWGSVDDGRRVAEAIQRGAQEILRRSRS